MNYRVMFAHGVAKTPDRKECFVGKFIAVLDAREEEAHAHLN
jgi:hypothetical protein